MLWEAAPEIGSAVTLVEGRKLAELAERNVVLEVGSWFGRSTVNLASTAERVHCIDWHRGETAEQKDRHYHSAIDSLVCWRDNMVRYGLLDKVVLHMGTSRQVCPFMRRYIFDLVFIDGDHAHDEVYEDIQQILPLLTLDGVVALHDYTFPDLGVESACLEWFGREPDEIVETLAIYRPER